MYFPAGKTAKIKDPQSLALDIAFNQPGRGGSATVIPFTHKDDHWEAIVPLTEAHAMYAIFLVQDDKTGAIDDNGGQFWDVVFCGPEGSKDANGTMAQARGYAGESWTASLRRAKNYDKAISILKTAKDQKPARDWWWVQGILKMEAQRDGNDAQAWAKVATELDSFAREHREKSDLHWVGSFVVEHQEQLPADFVDRFITAADAQINDPKNSLREQLEYNRAMMFMRDHKKSLAAFDAFVAKYPDGALAGFAQIDRFAALIALKDVAGAEAALAAYQEAQKHETRRDPNGYNDLLSLASLYIEKKIKLDEALKLIDEAQAWPQSGDGTWQMPVQFRRQIDAQSRLVRAQAYLALKQPAQALEQIKQSIEISKFPESRFVLAQALAANGEKKEALDAYFEAALQPSNKDLEYTAALEQFYVKEHFGNRRQFAAALEARQAEHFKASGYKPELVDQAAPEVKFVTLAGEDFTAEKLAGKTVVVNFWSPG